MSQPDDEEWRAAARRETPETVYERMPCGVLCTTPDGLILRVNSTILEWTGFSRESLEGRRTFSSLLTAGGQIYHDTHYGPMLRLHDQARELALEMVCADGTRLPVLVNAALERDEAGEPQVVRVAVFAATQRREYERELLRAKQRAEESEAHARSLAMALQQILIPPSPPDIPGLHVGAVYRPAGTGAEVGGDFYDVFEIAPDDWVVALGDVCGKGVEAAGVTALVRHTLRAVSVRLPSPAQALAVLDEVLAHHPSDRFCSVAVLRLRRRPEGWLLSLSLGGHPEPLLLRRGQPATSLGEPGSLVGAVPQPSYTETDVLLTPGSTVLLYTDGVTEGRRGSEFYGDERFRRVASRFHGADVAAGVLEDVLEFQRGRPRDDIALVAVSVPD